MLHNEGLLQFAAFGKRGVTSSVLVSIKTVNDFDSFLHNFCSVAGAAGPNGFSRAAAEAVTVG